MTRPPSPATPPTDNRTSAAASSSTTSFPFIPRYQATATFGQRFKAALPFPRLYSGPLFASAVNNTHIVSSIGPLTPPLTIDQSTSSPIPSSDEHKSKRQKFNAIDIVHDVYRCMFRITLDNKGTIAALCYLPTRFQKMVEFYHTEIPAAYRDLGLGDLLVIQGFRWAETAKLLVIPTCPFVRRYLEKNSGSWDCVVQSESEGLARLLTPSDDTLAVE